MDFGALPPEVNSSRMYSGPGSAPLLAAAAAWDAIGAEIHSAATSYESTISSLVGTGWVGPASATMAAAVAPYVTWLADTGRQATETASQAAAAAAAFEAAFALTIPPAVVAANRARLLALVATNFLGINTPTIAAIEAEYAEMWAQDATAMYGYAVSSADASVLTPFTEPTQIADPSGQTGQAAAVSRAVDAANGLVRTEASQLMPAAHAATRSEPFADVLNFLDGNDGNPYGIFLNSGLTNGWTSAGYTAPASIMPAITGALADFNAVAAGAAPETASVGAGSAPAAMSGTAVAQSAAVQGAAATTNQASLLGRLSVPQSWTTAVEPAGHAGAALPTAGVTGTAASPDAVAGMPGMPAAAGYARSYGNGPRYGFKLTIMHRPPSGG